MMATTPLAGVQRREMVVIITHYPALNQSRKILVMSTAPLAVKQSRERLATTTPPAMNQSREILMTNTFLPATDWGKPIARGRGREFIVC